MSKLLKFQINLYDKALRYLIERDKPLWNPLHWFLILLAFWYIQSFLLAMSICFREELGSIEKKEGGING